ncbi:hypothetical protein ACH5RR_011610 [Cinchona calisaya]|uniref:Glycine-rich domain-containing protein 1 n=1 Tax=Cinchona calisaya TaxID=153742 RepID=A0ABD3A6U5_9GENT
MEVEQELAWKRAQKTVINVDLVAAAKRHLQFLAAVDRNRCLYEGPVLDLAIYRYNVYWLPLLAKHSDSPLFEGPLVVPLDCEWIWHCHRLNPVRYKSDCEEHYGRILDSHNVVSTVDGASKTKTEEIWKSMYPDVPYELNLTRHVSSTVSKEISGVEKCTKYDLLSAVKRQSSFFYQVARSYMSNELYLEGAVARYKGFLHLIKRNRERAMKSFSVPTYDIDLIWHTHQLHPASYCKDLVQIMGKVLEHDDTDSDRTKGKKLDVGFSGTTKQWEEMYGVRYWRAGAMHKGNSPSPLRTTPYPSPSLTKKGYLSKEHQNLMHLPERKVVEVMLEFVSVKNLPERCKGGLFVSFRKKQPDTIFTAKRSLTILSESGEKQVACFHCQPTGNLFFELVCYSASNLPLSKSSKSLGSASISLEDLLSPSSNLTMEKWLEMVPSSNSENLKPIYLRVGISVTLPTTAPHVFHMIRSRPFSKNSCFFPLPGRVHLAKNWTRVIDDDGNEIINLKVRDFKKSKGKDDCMLRKEVISMIKSGATNTLAEFAGTEWLLMDSNWSLRVPGKVDVDGYLLELIGDRSVKLFPGRKLEYEPKHCEKQRNDHDFLTAVEFSAENPYGRAGALFDLKYGTFKVNEQWLLFPGLILAFILSERLRREGYDSLISSGKNLEGKECLEQKEYGCHMEGSKTIPTTVQEEDRKMDLEVSQGNAAALVKGGICSGGKSGNEGRSGACGGCGANCGNTLKNGSSEGGDGGCGSCGAGCGNMIKSGGCGGSGGCTGGCGNKSSGAPCVDAGACGGGCGSGCGNKFSSEPGVDAGACGGSGCGNKISGAPCVDAGACGGGCGSGCGNKIGGAPCVDGGACGGGCGSGCGNKIGGAPCVDGGACGGGCGSGCGNKIGGAPCVDAGACGGGCSGSGGCGGRSGNQLIDGNKAGNDCIVEQKEVLVA